MFKSKLRWITIVLIIFTVAAVACIQPTPPAVPEGNGTISVYVTDAPADDGVTGIIVTLSEVQVHTVLPEQDKVSSDNQSHEDESTWVTIDIDGGATFDLLQIEGVEHFLGGSEIKAAKYTQVRLVIDKVQVRLGSDELKDATLPSGELKLVHPFDVIEGEGIALIIDFDADKMVNVTGTDNIKVKPVVKLVTRKEKPTDQDEGQQTIESGTLEDIEWILVSYGNPDNLTIVLEDTEITTELNSANGRIDGNAGCNSYFAGYDINQNELMIMSPIGSTKMACPEPVMNQEAEYLKILQNMESYNVEGNQLRMVSGDKVLLFNRK
ncbi:DUF4382 domain-containing protein [Chloroflexota bacterium]